MKNPYYYYLVRSADGRMGYGIASDYIERNQFYAGHSGTITVFPVVWRGWRTHSKSLEKKCHTRLKDCRWVIEKPNGEKWTTEWLKMEYDQKFLENFITKIIEEEHHKLEVYKRNFTFDQI